MGFWSLFIPLVSEFTRFYVLEEVMLLDTGEISRSTSAQCVQQNFQTLFAKIGHPHLFSVANVTLFLEVLSWL